MKKKITKEQVLSGFMAGLQVLTPVAVPVTATAATAIVLAGCPQPDDPKPEQAKLQGEVITGLLDGNYSATVRGNFTDTEWAGVADTIKTELNAKYASSSTSQQDNFFKPAFADNVVITVEKNPPYAKYSAAYGSSAFSINYVMLDNPDELQQVLYDLVRVYGNRTSIPEIVNVMPQYNRAMMLRDNRIASRMTRVHATVPVTKIS